MGNQKKTSESFENSKIQEIHCVMIVTKSIMDKAAELLELATAYIWNIQNEVEVGSLRFNFWIFCSEKKFT